MRRRCSLMRRCLGISLPPLVIASSATALVLSPNPPTTQLPTTQLPHCSGTTRPPNYRAGTCRPNWQVVSRFLSGQFDPSNPSRPVCSE